MLRNILMGLFAMALCLLVQAFLLRMSVRYYVSQEKYFVVGPWASYKLVCIVVLLLVMGNLIQVAVWAGLFMLLGEFSDFATAYYHSAVNFSTLGYGDFVMSVKHRLLGPLESINGVLMIGVSTAAMMAVVSEVIKLGNSVTSEQSPED